MASSPHSVLDRTPTQGDPTPLPPGADRTRPADPVAPRRRLLLPALCLALAAATTGYAAVGVPGGPGDRLGPLPLRWWTLLAAAGFLLLAGLTLLLTRTPEDDDEATVDEEFFTRLRQAGTWLDDPTSPPEGAAPTVYGPPAAASTGDGEDQLTRLLQMYLQDPAGFAAAAQALTVAATAPAPAPPPATAELAALRPGPTPAVEAAARERARAVTVVHALAATEPADPQVERFAARVTAALHRLGEPTRAASPPPAAPPVAATPPPAAPSTAP